MSTENYSPYTYPAEWYEEVKKLNIYQRIHGAMADAKPVAKTSKDGIKFKFHGHEGVSAMVKALAEKWRFVIEAQVVSSELQMLEIYSKPRPLTILTVSVSFVNIDKPEESMSTMTVGYGVDESDKGPGKALSYAIKMAELKTFSIYDGEKLDNEEFCYQHEREEKQMNDLRQKWVGLVKALKLDVKEQGARLKSEYGDPPSLEAIQIDCDEMQIELDKMNKRTQAGKEKEDKERRQAAVTAKADAAIAETTAIPPDLTVGNKINFDGADGPKFGED